MKASPERLLAFLRKSTQFVIPIYQRTYSWTENECCQLWDDIIRAGSSDAIPVHFLGSIVYIEEGLSQVSHRAPSLLIDGQQRLTTVTLLLAALAEALGDAEPVDGFSAQKLRDYYLLNPLESDERHYKLLLSQTDRESLISIIKQHERMPVEGSLRIKQNYELFKELIADQQDNLAAVWEGLLKLSVVDIALERGQDDPQLIFESMNSTGRALSQADLIRNFILMDLDTTLQERFYEQFWRKMEISFGQEAYSAHFDSFMRHYLTVRRNGEIPRLREVYERFKDYARRPEIKKAGVELLVKDLRDFSEYYCAMALGKETDRTLEAAFHDLRELKVDVAYPFLLELYQDYATGLLSKPDFVEAVRLVEAYVFRRAVCEIPTNSLNKTFATFSREIKKDRYLESIRAHFLLMPSYRRFPKDNEFVRDIQKRDLYNFRNRSYWLRRFENYDRPKEQVHVDEYTIEHIMPQELSNDWKIALGEEWERVHQTYLHTLGNLTLTGYNSEYSNRSFREKRDMDRGFRESPLKVNAGLGDLDAWNEEAIKSRALKLANQATEVWRMPNLTEDVLVAYRPQSKKSAGYSIEDHPNLQKAPMSELFEKLKNKIMELDPCVSEEFLKYYVAYKAETNFVDVNVVVKEKQLRLSLNIGFSEIRDPRGICKDISAVGRWANGDVEVRLGKLDDLPYVIGLVRQSLEKQLGDGGDA